MGSIKKFSFIVARFFLSSIFLMAAFAHISDFDGMESAITNALYSISEHSGGKVWVQSAVEELMPLVPVMAVTSLVLLVLGGCSVLLGIKYRLGAFLLILFLLPVTFIMHHFYFLEGPSKELEAQNFWKNLAILGGLIVLASYPHAPKASHDDDF